VFPFRHRIEIAVRLDPEGLNIETTLQATGDEPVPVSFGFHPYFALPDLPRRQWRLSLPRMHQLALDGRRIPRGATTRFEPFEAPLAEHDFDDGFELDAEGATLAISGNGLRIGVELLAGYRYVQVYAPKGRSLISLEPMTAPTNALASGSGIAVVEPGKSYRAEFRVGIGADAR
jgi:aldose 1-epimerase